MSAPDFSRGIEEQAGLISFLVGAWHDFGYEVPPTPECKPVPPLGERSANAVKAGREAIGAIDELGRRLSALRSQLAAELRQDEDARARRGNAVPSPATAGAAAASDAGSPQDALLNALRAVREALDIPHPATVGDGEVHDRILNERVMHAVVMLRSALEPGRHPDIPWSTAYLRDRLAEHPAEGYKTWQQQAAEIEAACESGGAL